MRCDEAADGFVKYGGARFVQSVVRVLSQARALIHLEMQARVAETLDAWLVARARLDETGLSSSLPDAWPRPVLSERRLGAGDLADEALLKPEEHMDIRDEVRFVHGILSFLKTFRV
eukprot:6182855-Pleurochrysis_carterae.AAC.2